MKKTELTKIINIDKRKCIAAILLCVAIFLTACGEQYEATPEPNKATATASSDSDTHTAVPSAVPATATPTPTVIPTEVPTPTPTATSTATPEIREVKINLNVLLGNYVNAFYDDDNSVKETLFPDGVAGINIKNCKTMVYYKLPVPVYPGETVSIHIVGKTDGESGFRNYLINSDSCWDSCSDIHEECKDMSYQDIDIKFDIQAKSLADAVTFRIPKFGEQIENITIKSIEVIYYLDEGETLNDRIGR